MSLPSAVEFAAGDLDYIDKLNQFVDDANELDAAFRATTAPAGFVGTSSTSLTMGTGDKTFTLNESTARAWAPGMTLRVSDHAVSHGYGEGQIKSYAHPSITITIASVSATPTSNLWDLGLASPSADITNMQPGSAAASQTIQVNGAGSAIVGVTVPSSALYDELSRWAYN